MACAAAVANNRRTYHWALKRLVLDGTRGNLGFSHSGHFSHLVIFYWIGQVRYNKTGVFASNALFFLSCLKMGELKSNNGPDPDTNLLKNRINTRTKQPKVWIFQKYYERASKLESKLPCQILLYGLLAERSEERL